MWCTTNGAGTGVSGGVAGVAESVHLPPHVLCRVHVRHVYAPQAASHASEEEWDVEEADLSPEEWTAFQRAVALGQVRVLGAGCWVLVCGTSRTRTALETPTQWVALVNDLLWPHARTLVPLCVCS